MANKVTINTDALGITWSPGTSYRVALDEGFIKEDGGDEANNEANANFFAFTTNSIGPSFTTSTPAPGGTGFVDSVVSIQYNRFIRKNTGNIRLYKLSGDTLVATVSVTSASVTTNNDILAVDFAGYIWDPVAEYYILADTAVVRDYDGFESIAISNTATLRFTTGLAPVIVSSSPADNATLVTNTSSMTFTFDANMAPYAGGFIKLYDGSNNLINSFNVNGGNVSYSGNNVIVDSTGYITKGSTQYYWLIDENVLASTGGFLFGGVTDSNAFRYTTKAFPSITFSPTDNSTGVTNNSTLTLSFAELVTANSAHYIKLYEAGTNTLKTTIEATDASYVSSNGLNYYIIVDGYLKSQTEYYVTIDAGAFETVNGIQNNVVSAGTWSFTMAYLIKLQYQLGNGSKYIAATENYFYLYTDWETSSSVEVRSLTDGTLVRTLTGKFLAAEGTNVLLGGPGFNSGTLFDGEAYLYNASNGALIRTFVNPSPGLGSLDGDGTETSNAGDYFGNFGGISGNLVAISAPWENTTTRNNTGRVYIFNISTGALVSTLENPNTTEVDTYFGTTISMNSDYLTVGAYLNGATQVGAVYMYPTGSGSTAPLRTFTAGSANDLLGTSLASSGPYSIIGAADGSSTAITTDYGAVYVYNSDLGTYNTLTNPYASSSYPYPGWGESLAANSEYFMVGTSYNTVLIYNTTTRNLITTIYARFQSDDNNPNGAALAANEQYYFLKSSSPIESGANLLYQSNFSLFTGSSTYTAKWITRGVNTASSSLNPATGNASKQITEVVTLNQSHGVSQDFDASTYPEQFSRINQARPLTISVYAKAGTNNFINILPIHSKSGEQQAVGASFNLSNGTTSVLNISTWATNVSAAMTSISGGWYRCSLTIYQDLSSSGDISDINFFLGKQHLISTVSWGSTGNSESLSYVGNTGQYLNLADAQINIGASPATYQATTTALGAGLSGQTVIVYKEDV